MNPQVSFIITAYNAEKYIKKCIYSILNQVDKYTEIIIVNDGSTDTTKQICEEIRDERVKLYNNSNHGVSYSRNFAVERSTGDYIVFVDGDDELVFNFYEKISSVINEKNEKDRLILYGIEKYNVDSNQKSYIIDNNYREGNKVYLSKTDFLELYNSNLINSPCNKVFKSNIIKNNNIRFDCTLSIGEDLIFVLEYLKFVDGYCLINEGLYKYINRNTSSLSVKSYENMYEIQMRLFNSIVEHLKFSKCEIDSKEIKKIYYLLVWRSIRNFLRLGNTLKVTDRFKKIIKIIFSKNKVEFYKEGQFIILNIYNVKVFIWYINYIRSL